MAAFINQLRHQCNTHTDPSITKLCGLLNFWSLRADDGRPAGPDIPLYFIMSVTRGFFDMLSHAMNPILSQQDPLHSLTVYYF